MKIIQEVISSFDTPITNTIIIPREGEGTTINGSLQYANGETFVIRDSDDVEVVFSNENLYHTRIKAERTNYNKFSFKLDSSVIDLSETGKKILLDVVINRDKSTRFITNDSTIEQLVVKE